MIKDIPDNEDLISEASMEAAFNLVMRANEKKPVSKKKPEAETGRDAEEGR